MKKLLIGILAIIAVICLAACEEKKEPEVTTPTVVDSGETNTTTEPEFLPASQSDEMYQKVIDDYKGALATFNLEDIDAEEKMLNEYGYVNPNLVVHLTRYADTGAEITFDFYDIDKNGIKEFIIWFVIHIPQLIFLGIIVAIAYFSSRNIREKKGFTFKKEKPITEKTEGKDGQ